MAMYIATAAIATATIATATIVTVTIATATTTSVHSISFQRIGSFCDQRFQSTTRNKLN